MGRVIDYIECVNCKEEAVWNFYYKSKEEYIDCSKCGYYYHAEIKSREKCLEELTTSDWDIQECMSPYGSYSLKYKDVNVKTCESLRNEAEWKALKENVKTKKYVEYFTLSRLIEGKIIVEHII